MTASSVSDRAGTRAPSGAKSLRLLRFLFVVLAFGAAAALPFELGMLPLPSFLRPASPIISATNYPYTAVAGQTEQFSVQLAAGMAHTPLTFVLTYPDGHVARADGTTDAQGRASHTFRLDGYRPHHFREAAKIGVTFKSGSTAVSTSLRFAIQRKQK